MNSKPYLIVSGVIFFVVGLLHLSRLVFHWTIQVGGSPVPDWVSYLGLPVAWALAVWAYRLRRR